MSIELVYHKDEGNPSPFDSRAIEIAQSSTLLRIACPYLSLSYLERILDLAEDWALVTDISEWLASTPTSKRPCTVDFIKSNMQDIRDLAGLHAKVLIGDESAMIGSANFTVSGMTRRTEMSVIIHEKTIVDEVTAWFDGLWKAGADLGDTSLNDLLYALPAKQPDNRRKAVTHKGAERKTILVSLEEPEEPHDMRHYKNATGYYTGDGNKFCVTKGSLVKRQADALKRNKPTHYKYRKFLIDLGTLVQENESSDYKLCRDITFDSPSEAACNVDGNSRSGPEAWGRK